MLLVHVNLVCDVVLVLLMHFSLFSSLCKNIRWLWSNASWIIPVCAVQNMMWLFCDLWLLRNIMCGYAKIFENMKSQWFMHVCMLKIWYPYACLYAQNHVWFIPVCAVQNMMYAFCPLPMADKEWYPYAFLCPVDLMIFPLSRMISISKYDCFQANWQLEILFLPKDH